MNGFSYWASSICMNMAGALAAIAILPQPYSFVVVFVWAVTTGVFWAIAVPRKEKA